MQKLGSGSGGTVYAMTDKLAVKRISLEQMYEAIPEIVIMHTCDHPHIIRAKSAHYSDKTIHIITERYRSDLGGKLMSPAEAMKMSAQISSALAYMHDRGFIHADVKPHNILRSDQGYFLCDFGLSVVNGPGKMMVPLQTYCYRAPEVPSHITTCTITAKIDVWSLGCVIYEVIAGRRLFPDASPDTHRFGCNKADICELFGVDSDDKLSAVSREDVKQILAGLYPRMMTTDKMRKFLEIIASFLVPSVLARASSHEAQDELGYLIGVEIGPQPAVWPPETAEDFPDIIPPELAAKLDDCSIKYAARIHALGLSPVYSLLVSVCMTTASIDRFEQIEEMADDHSETKFIESVIRLFNDQ